MRARRAVGHGDGRRRTGAPRMTRVVAAGVRLVVAGTHEDEEDEEQDEDVEDKDDAEMKQVLEAPAVTYDPESPWTKYSNAEGDKSYY